MKRKVSASSSKAKIGAILTPISRRLEAGAHVQDACASGIVLIGMMGAGKSSVGRCLHKRMGWALLDLDEMIAARFRSSIPKIFEMHGEEKFRDAETETLLELVSECRGDASSHSVDATPSSRGYGNLRSKEFGDPSVASTSLRRGRRLRAIVVTGGGIVLRQENFDLMKQLGTVVWLDADEETLFTRASREGDRPLLETENPRKTFSQLLEARRPLYAKIAEARIDTSGRSEKEVVEEILEKIEHLTR